MAPFFGAFFQPTGVPSKFGARIAKKCTSTAGCLKERALPAALSTAMAPTQRSGKPVIASRPGAHRTCRQNSNAEPESNEKQSSTVSPFDIERLDGQKCRACSLMKTYFVSTRILEI
jgi:hypothetical protein